MIKICIMTSTRAEYGLLSPIIKKMNNDSEFETHIVVTGAHLSPEFGMTIEDIFVDGICVDKKIEILMSSDSPVAISKSMGLAMISFAEYFDELTPDLLMVLGDRYETLAVCCAAMNARIPIVHLHGGETTEGAVDEAVRHAITKMSYLHFASTDEYRHRIIQMGENPERVFSVGAMGVENALKIPLMSKEDLEKSLGCTLGDKYAVGTFHPVTLENCSAEKQTMALMDAIQQYQEITFLFTKANADTNGRVINRILEEYKRKCTNLLVYESLGMKRYLSALKNAEFVIGNSSSGIIEAPSFHIPTINIGDRQRGRIQGESIINCEPNNQSICDAINRAMNSSYREKLQSAINPYGRGNTSDRIIEITKERFKCDKEKLKKSFYDIKFTVE